MRSAREEGSRVEHTVSAWDGQHRIKVTQERPPPPSSTHGHALTPELSHLNPQPLVGEHFSSMRSRIRKMFGNGMLFPRMITCPEIKKKHMGESAGLGLRAVL